MISRVISTIMHEDKKKIRKKCINWTGLMRKIVYHGEKRRKAPQISQNTPLKRVNEFLHVWAHSTTSPFIVNVCEGGAEAAS